MSFLSEIRAAGASIALKDGGLAVKGASTELIGQIKARKAEAIALLEHEERSARDLCAKLDDIWEIAWRFGKAGADAKAVQALQKFCDMAQESIIDDYPAFMANRHKAAQEVLALVAEIRSLSPVLEGMALEHEAKATFFSPSPQNKKTNRGAFSGTAHR